MHYIQYKSNQLIGIDQSLLLSIHIVVKTREKKMNKKVLTYEKNNRQHSLSNTTEQVVVLCLTVEGFGWEPQNSENSQLDTWLMMNDE